MSRLRTRHRYLWLLVGLLACVLVAGGALAWSWRADLVAWEVRRVVESQGLGPAEFVVDRVDLAGLHARDVSLRGGALRAASLTIAWSPLALLRFRLGELEIAGLDLDLRGREGGGATPGGLSFASAPSGGRIESIKLTDAHLAFATGRTVYRLSFSGDAAWDGNAARIANATATLADPPWEADDIQGELRFAGDRASLDLAAMTLHDRARAPYLAPIDLRGTATLAASQAEFAAHLEIAAPEGKGALALDLKGRHDLTAGTGTADLVMAPVAFALDGLQPVDFFPRLGALAKIAGTLSASGPVRWRGGDLSSSLVLRLAGGAVDWPAGRLDGLAGEVKLTDLRPFVTPPGQELTGHVDIGGLPPSNATIRFQLRPAWVLAIESASFEFAQGRIVTAPFAVDPAAAKIETALQVTQIDLADLLQLIGLEGLSGTGRLDGRIPLALDGGRVRIADASLAASGPGVLRFKSDALPPQITGAGKDMELALRALEDFHYEALSLKLDERTTGEGTILLALRGANPAVLQGRAFNINIKLESNFDRLTDIAFQSMSAAQELLQRAARSLTK